MTHSDDRFSRLIADDGEPDVGLKDVGWSSPDARAAFWILSVVATFVLALAWFWYGFAFFEEMTEQCKSLAADSSAAGTGLALGAIPLAIAYVITVVPLVLVGVNYRARRGTGALVALAVVFFATGIGIGVNELLWGGDLFAMSTGSATCTSS
ncbi:hypothetical protein ACWPKO_29920 (plasmid) [Coraliomargarita sp. W4R53]